MLSHSPWYSEASPAHGTLVATNIPVLEAPSEDHMDFGSGTSAASVMKQTPLLSPWANRALSSPADLAQVEATGSAAGGTSGDPGDPNIPDVPRTTKVTGRLPTTYPAALAVVNSIRTVCTHPGCGQSFSSPSNRTRHEGTVHRAAQPCPRCGTPIKTRADYVTKHNRAACDRKAKKNGRAL